MPTGNGGGRSDRTRPYTTTKMNPATVSTQRYRFAEDNESMFTIRAWWPPALLLVVACGESSVAEPLSLPSCSSNESPRELMRIADPDSAITSLDVHDLDQAVSAAFILYGESEREIVDNCGGNSIRIRGTFGQRTGVMNRGGEIVLCSSENGEPDGVWELLDDGSPGELLDPALHCKRLSSSLFDSYGFVASGDDLLQTLPDGTTRPIPGIGAVQFLWTGGGPSVFMNGRSPTIHPPDGSAAIELDLPNATEYVVPQRGVAEDADWILAVPAFSEGQGLSPGQDVFSPLYAVQLSTGDWFETPAVSWSVGSLSDEVSIRDGLLATDAESGLALSRPGWEAPLSTDDDIASFTVLDTERVFLINAQEYRIVRVPLEPPTAPEELEVLWSRPRSTAGDPPSVAGVAWNGIVLVEREEEVWAYPLDDREPYVFLPAYSLAHFGREYVTALGADPDSSGELRLTRNRVDGEFEIVDSGIVSGQIGMSSGEVLVQHAWTPDLGRFVYGVRDGDAVSIRQHRFDD